MKVTLQHLRALRDTLTEHRIKHEKLVTEMKILRQNCQEVRSLIKHTKQLREEASLSALKLEGSTAA